MSVDPFSEEATTVDLENVDADSINESGTGISKAGKYHFFCTGVDIKSESENPDDEKFIPEVHVLLRAEASEHESEVGKSMTSRIRLMNPVDWGNRSLGLKPLESRDLVNIAALLYGFGVIGEDIYGTQFQITRDMYERLDGCHAICEVTRKETTNKTTGEKRTFSNIYGNNVWRCEHPSVADVPKDANLVNTIIPDDNVKAEDTSSDEYDNV